MICRDANGTPLDEGMAVMCIANGHEEEGVVTKLKNNNKIEVEGETGLFTTDAKNTYFLPC